VRARTIDDRGKGVRVRRGDRAQSRAQRGRARCCRQQTVVDSELIDELAQNLEMEQNDLSESDDRHLAQAVAD